MAEAMGISPSSVGRIWAEAGLKPHITKGFKVSNDPKFEEKVTDIVGLYLDPPDRAVVLCVDEKSQIQALDRTQPGLPLKKGRAAGFANSRTRVSVNPGQFRGLGPVGHRLRRHGILPVLNETGREHATREASEAHDCARHTNHIAADA